jgi:TrpR-related protein YerC/YecD
MAKFSSKLSKKEVGEYFYQLCLAISEIKNPEEAAELLRDLLSYQEAEMIAKRLKIAELISKNLTYEEIMDELKVGASTISRVREWMKVSGEGYRKATKRIRGKKTEVDIKNYDYESWGKMKKRFPVYYWPQILVEGLVREANVHQKKRIENVIKQMDKAKEKSELFYHLKRLMRKSGK